MIGIDLYRCCVGLFNLRSRHRVICGDLFLFSFVLPWMLTLNIGLPNLLAQCNDVETNPGPRYNRSSSKPFSCCHVNIRSILAQTEVTGVLKVDELASLVDVKQFDVIGVTETWLDSSISSEKLAIPGCLPPLRRDRNCHGGGVIVDIFEHVAAKRRTDIEPGNHEIVCIELNLLNTPVLISVCYRPPNTNTAEFMESIDSIKERAVDIHSMIFTGDFLGGRGGSVG